MNDAELYPPHPFEKQRRVGARLKVRLDGRYRLISHREWRACVVLDVGIGGIFLETSNSSFYAGDKIEVEFHLEERRISGFLEITNITGKAAGARFYQVAREVSSFIGELLHKTYFSGSRAQLR